MAGLRELRKRLRSVKTTGQIAGAMRTAATAKYARVNVVRTTFGPYSEACADILCQLGSAGIARESSAVQSRNCFILLGSNRGLCGGFNAELFRFAYQELGNAAAPLLLAGSAKASSFCREQGYTFEEFPVSDVPSFAEAKAISDRIRELFCSGAVENVYILYPKFHNMLTQEPICEQLLPAVHTGKADAEKKELLFLPDKEQLAAQLAISCLESRLFEILLDNAAGAQAATLLAMRNACDNAEASAAKLELTINRRRQAEVTASVIETASGNLQQGE